MVIKDLAMRLNVLSDTELKEEILAYENAIREVKYDWVKASLKATLDTLNVELAERNERPLED